MLFRRCSDESSRRVTGFICRIANVGGTERSRFTTYQCDSNTPGITGPYDAILSWTNIPFFLDANYLLGSHHRLWSRTSRYTNDRNGEKYISLYSI